jgi:hypothetical protein
MKEDLGVEKLGPLTNEEMEAILTVGL